MLAYTTFSSLFQMPSALEVAVYVGGLLLVLAFPYVFFSLMADGAAETEAEPGLDQSNS